MEANVLHRELLTIISNCEVEPVTALLAFPQAYEIEWLDLEAIGRFLYNFALTMTIAGPEWNADGCKRGRSSSRLPGAAHSKVAPRYVKKR